MLCQTGSTQIRFSYLLVLLLLRLLREIGALGTVEFVLDCALEDHGCGVIIVRIEARSRSLSSVPHCRAWRRYHLLQAKDWLVTGLARFESRGLSDRGILRVG